MSAFDFSGVLEDPIEVEVVASGFRADAERLAEDGRKVMDDLREAERREHGQG